MEDQYTDLVADIRGRVSRAKSIRSDYEELWDDIVNFVNVRRYNLDGTKRKGLKVGSRIYDSTAAESLKLMTDGIFGYHISPGMLWYRLRVRNEALMSIKKVKQWLEDVTWITYTALQRSNFYEVMPEYLQDGGSIGTATLYSEEDRESDRIVFIVCHPGDIWIAENKYSVVDTVFRRIVLTARQAVQKFENTSELSTQLVEDSKDLTRMENLYTFYHITQPKNDMDMIQYRGKRYPKISASNKPILSMYLQDGENHPVSVSGYYTHPYQVWRYRKNSNEPYGSSPASDAIIDILTSNQMSKTLLHASHMAAEPPLNIPAELKGKVRIIPRGMNHFEDPARIISAIQMGADKYPIGKDREDRVRDAVRKHFNTEFFTLLSRAAMDGRQLNVPQVMEMQGEKAVMLSTMLGRLNSDCLNPALNRVYLIESMAGRIPPPPDVLVADGGKVQVEYLGPLAQAQRRLFKTGGIYQGLAAIDIIAAKRPDVYDNVDLDVITTELLAASGMPEKAIKDPRVVTAERNARAKQAEAQQQMAVMLEAAKTMPALSKKPEQGSMAGMLTNGE